MTSSILQQKSLELGINVAKFSISLKDQKMFEIASQFLKSGTSVGANIAEAR
jgi:four helix bundle protein